MARQRTPSSGLAGSTSLTSVAPLQGGVEPDVVLGYISLQYLLLTECFLGFFYEDARVVLLTLPASFDDIDRLKVLSVKDACRSISATMW